MCIIFPKKYQFRNCISVGCLVDSYRCNNDGGGAVWSMLLKWNRCILRTCANGQCTEWCSRMLGKNGIEIDNGHLKTISEPIFCYSGIKVGRFLQTLTARYYIVKHTLNEFCMSIHRIWPENITNSVLFFRFIDP